MQPHYGHLLRILHWCNDQSMTNALAQMELTSAQGMIMGYLTHHTQAPCSRDLEEAFHLSHPTVSGLLSRMEKKGFIEFRSDPADRRCKRIYVLEKGRRCAGVMHETIRQNENRMVEGFSPEEQEQFYQFLQRAIANMGASPCKHHKEET